MALSNTRTGYIINCLITSNRVSTGGGIYQETFSGAGVFWATNCIVRGNYATYGGGIKFSTGGRYVSCVIENNVANYGGGIGNSSLNNTSMIISNCFIINNRSTVSSGGGGVYSLSPAKFANCVITGNVANGPGGGLLIENADLQDCIIIGNSSTNNNGGGVYGTNINLRNCLVAQNTAKTNAGGVYFYKRGTIMNCTVAGNYAGVLGGGLFITNASVYGTNSIIYHNTAGVSADNFTNTAGNTGLDYSCVFPAVNGVSNIISAPAFASVNGGNYRLTGQSPCFNTGTNQNWMTNAVDLDGRARILYNYVDMGCYEYRLPASGSTFTFH